VDSDGGARGLARSVVRGANHRIRCEVTLDGPAEAPVLDACRTLSAP
jgi:hypothetical protein